MTSTVQGRAGILLKFVEKNKGFFSPLFAIKFLKNETVDENCVLGLPV